MLRFFLTRRLMLQFFLPYLLPAARTLPDFLMALFCIQIIWEQWASPAICQSTFREHPQTRKILIYNLLHRWWASLWLLKTDETKVDKADTPLKLHIHARGNGKGKRWYGCKGLNNVQPFPQKTETAVRIQKFTILYVCGKVTRKSFLVAHLKWFLVESKSRFNHCCMISFK